MSSPSASTKCPRDISWGTERDIYSFLYFLMFYDRKEILNTRCLFKVSDFSLSIPAVLFLSGDYFLFNNSEIIVFMINELYLKSVSQQFRSVALNGREEA